MSGVVVIGAAVIAGLVAYAYYEEEPESPKVMKSPFKNTDAAPPGCTTVSRGLYRCDQLKIMVSSYRIPQYDPPNPTVKIGDAYYFYRQGI